MKNFLKKYYPQIIIITIPLLLVFITTGFNNIFGSNTDWINQHTVIPEYLRQTFYQTGKLLPNLSLNYGGGQNIYNFSYYGLLSPLILPSYLLPFLSMTTYIIIINILVVIVSGLLFYSFLKKHQFNTLVSLTTTIIFITSAPFIFQMHRHIMFVNYMPFLIMSLWGVDNLLNKNKPSLLIINVFLMIMTSYYYSVGGIIVTGIYYIYTYLQNKEFNLRTFIPHLLKFILYLLVAILLSAILLVPTMYTLLIGRGTSETTYNLVNLLIPNLKFHKIFCGTYAIGLSTIGFISLLYLFYTKKKNNIIPATLTSLVLFIPIFCYILNGGLYLREKCFIPFIPLISYYIAYFLKDLYNSKINIKNFSIYLIVIFILLYYFNKLEYCYLTFIGLIILLIICKKYKKPIIISTYLILASLIICIVENLGEDIVSIKEYQEYFNKDITTNIQEILNTDTTFYRFNNLDNPTKTMNKIYNYNYYTTNIYSSTYNKYYLDFTHNDLITSSINYNYFLLTSNKNILFNSYMGVKYLYSTTNPGLGYTKISNNIYKNNTSMPIIYGTNNITNTKDYNNYKYPYNLEVLFSSAIIDNENTNTTINNQIKEIYPEYKLLSKENVTIEKNNQGYIIKSDDNGHITLKLQEKLENKLLFIDLEGLTANSCRIDNIKMTINNDSNILTCKTWIYNNKNNTFHFLINDKTIDTIDITLNKGTYTIDNIHTYILDYNYLLNINNNITSMNITSINNDTINGTINTSNNGYLITTIPYDKGFSIYIDNKLVDTIIVNKSFLGTKLPKGYHNITIKYTTPWLNIAKILSLLGVSIYIIILIKEGVSNEKNKRTIPKI